MIKKIILLSAVCACVLLAFASCEKTSVGNNSNDFLNASLPPLVADGMNLVDDNGNTVKLRGVNLGGWLVFEEWFCPVYDNKDTEPKAAGKEIYDILLSRFSEQEVDTLIKAYQDNWITEYDLDYLQSIGVNCVRVPFWYRNFQNADGSWKLNEEGKIDFYRLDWIVEQCGKRGIYVILDMHGAPGFQSIAHHVGANNECHLFDDTAEGEVFREQTVYLWKELAEHYNGCSAVAGFDLLNEPYCDMNFDEKAYENINTMYDTLYKAIREVNPSTVVIMEAMWRLNKLPNPQIYGWENVMYEVHYYGYTTKEAVDGSAKHLTDYSAEYNVPVYVGEFECGEFEAYAIELFSDVGASYTTWTYKGSPSSVKQWFLRYSDNVKKANIVTDSYDTILEKWSDQISTEYVTKNFFGNEKKYSYEVNEDIEQAIINSAK